ncbi:Peptidase M15B [uncultured Caudovirales phage]|uniref:Peptidase M15B n=1 Tax=uncultured Caudovirales phage TaxID=2100421 RepID=A0A6J7WU59_9CAUD|nr:Peptidase M15B [uncultured Caudovirales phage]
MAISDTLLSYFPNSNAATGIAPDVASNLERFLRDNPHGARVGSGYRSSDHQASILTGKIRETLGAEAANRWQADVQSMGAEAAGQQWRSQLQGAGITKWVALPGSSNHQKSKAFDLQFSNDDAKKWAHENAATYGFKFPMSHEPWHLEPVGSSDSTTADSSKTASSKTSNPASTTNPFTGEVSSQASATPSSGGSSSTPTTNIVTGLPETSVSSLTSSSSNKPADNINIVTGLPEAPPDQSNYQNSYASNSQPSPYATFLQVLFGGSNV